MLKVLLGLENFYGFIGGDVMTNEATRRKGVEISDQRKFLGVPKS
jgi:hypothetical protein